MRVWAAVAGYTVRTCMPRGRMVGMAFLALACAAFGLLARLGDLTPEAAFARAADAGIFGLVLPLAALIVGDAILAADIRKGTFLFTWLSPTSLLTIVTGRWAAGVLLTAAVVAPAAALAAALASAPASSGWAALAVTAGSCAYMALFLAVGVSFRRAPAIFLAIVFLGERLLGGALSGIAQLSPLWEADAVFDGLASGTTPRRGIPIGWAALGRLALMTVALLAVAHLRLAKVRPAASGD